MLMSWLSLLEELKEFDIVERKKVKIISTLDPRFEVKLFDVLKCNIGTFAWSLEIVLGIDTNFLYHKLALDPSVKPII